MKILIAVDGSTHSGAAVQEVARLTWPADSEIRVEAALATLRDGDCTTLRLTSETFHGSAKQVTVDEANKWGADLIVLGSRGLGALDRFLLGSVSQAVVNHAPFSVEVVRPSRSEESRRQSQ